MFTKTLKFGFVVLLIFNITAEEITTVELKPGLWSYTYVLTVEGKGVVHEDTHKHCIKEADANPTVQRLLADILEGDCSMTNFEHTLGNASLNARCFDPEMQLTSVGEINVTYSNTAYSAIANVDFAGPGGTSKAKSVVNANYLSECN